MDVTADFSSKVSRGYRTKDGCNGSLLFRILQNRDCAEFSQLTSGMRAHRIEQRACTSHVFAPAGLRSGVIARLRRLIGQHAICNTSDATPTFDNLLDVFESMKSKPLAH